MNNDEDICGNPQSFPKYILLLRYMMVKLCVIKLNNLLKKEYLFGLNHSIFITWDNYLICVFYLHLHQSFCGIITGM